MKGLGGDEVVGIRQQSKEEGATATGEHSVCSADCGKVRACDRASSAK